MTHQLSEWKGDFGVEYTRRNVVDWRTRVEGFAHMLDGYRIETVLEVGANRGHNLQALASLGYQVTGVEPQPYARALAQGQALNVRAGDAYALPFATGSFDLVFTSGVLIHVPPDRLADAITELVRVTRRYVLAIEYHADTDTPMPYRDRDGLMWNRDYAAHYERHGLALVASGQLGDAFDTARFALMSKSERSG